WYPRVIEIMHLVFAGGLMYQPSSFDVFDSPIDDDIRKYNRGATVSAEENIRLFKLAQDLAISDFGSRCRSGSVRPKAHRGLRCSLLQAEGLDALL
ncbi:4-hydroxyphenylacetate 3-hydroxylase C-terminal domain-containing protein, partial [Hydrogenibacillus schlegelii]|uniref:4-hydroxyphenylacetate 3-hydroxylase C-terminal domain-containing protein n=1 Tax=Hydrogenibacillus schlegelii TaxID=1484 RepID=UPI0034A03ECB